MQFAPNLERFGANIQAIASSPEILLLFNVVAIVLLVAMFVAWRRALAREQALVRANAGLDVDIAVVQTCLESEMKQRLVRRAADPQKSASAAIGAKPRELLEILSKENFSAHKTSEVSFAQEGLLVDGLEASRH